jgi:hypothetical protein
MTAAFKFLQMGFLEDRCEPRSLHHHVTRNFCSELTADDIAKQLATLH